jgi:hypothetical protein
MGKKILQEDPDAVAFWHTCFISQERRFEMVPQTGAPKWQTVIEPWTKIISSAIPVLTLMTFVMSWLAELARREQLKLYLLALSTTDVFLMAAPVMMLLGGIVLGAVLMRQFAFWLTPRLPRRLSSTAVVLGWASIIVLIAVNLLAPSLWAEAYILTGSMQAISVLAGCLAMFLFPQQRPIGEGKPIETGLRIGTVVIAFLYLCTSSILLGNFLSLHSNHLVVTFSTSVIPNTDGREFLVLGSDDKQVAVLMAPDTSKGEGTGSFMYIARSEPKTFTVKRITSVLQFTQGWHRRI